MQTSLRRKILKMLVALVAILVLAMLAIVAFTVGGPQVSLPLPNPNGYDDFRKAAAVVTGDVGNSPTLDHDGLQALISSNAEPLRLTRIGLSRRCSVPTDSAMTNLTGLLTDLGNLKSIARLLEEEGRLAEMEGRYADAARSYVDAIRFGNEMSRGGFIINRLVGIACEAIGQTPLSKLVPKLDHEEARRVMAELEKIDSTGVTWDEVLRSESRFARYQISKGSFNPIAWVMSRWQERRSRQRAEMRHRRVVAHVRLVAAELALRCYRLEEAHPPGILEELVPKYLQRAPRDPFTDRSMIYRVSGTNWLLYSIGEDGVDDGGKPVGRSSPGTIARGDLFYDSPY